MADVNELTATVREHVGKGAARAIRRDGRIPAVVYGDKKPPEAVILDYKEIRKQYETGLFLSTVYALDINGKKTRVIPRDIQFEPVKDFIQHVDFLRLAKGAEVTVEVPVSFLNELESPGLKRGGVLNVVRYVIELVCPAEDIPESIEADLTGLEIGDSVHISAITLPENVRPSITDRDFTIATIVGAVPSEEEEADEDGEEIAADEVPTVGGEEGEGDGGDE